MKRLRIRRDNAPCNPLRYCPRNSLASRTLLNHRAVVQLVCGDGRYVYDRSRPQVQGRSHPGDTHCIAQPGAKRNQRQMSQTTPGNVPCARSETIQSSGDSASTPEPPLHKQTPMRSPKTRLIGSKGLLRHGRPCHIAT